MPIYYPNLACLKMADELKTALAAAKCRLFKTETAPGEPFLPSVSTTPAQLAAAECDFDGYPAGGLTVITMSPPLLDPIGGASIESPILQFAYTDGAAHKGNVVGGFWVEDATAHLRLIGVFPQPIPVQGPGQGIPLNFKCVEPTGLTV
jgi:hypothetical protein